MRGERQGNARLVRAGAIAASTAILAVAIGAASTASAGVGHPTTVTLVNGAPAFHGRVNSDHPACVSHRRVKMMMRQPGPDLVLGIDNAAITGRWFVDHPDFPSGEYYARAPAKNVPDEAVCLADRSAIVAVD